VEPARCDDLMVEQADVDVKCRADVDSIATSYRWPGRDFPGIALMVDLGNVGARGARIGCAIILPLGGDAETRFLVGGWQGSVSAWPQWPRQSQGWPLWRQRQ
jgi:hypothetical protein